MIVGRTSEIASIASFLDDASDGPICLILEGEPGIGKSVLWARAVEDARRRDYRVMSCRPTGPDAQLSFVALGDLFSTDADPLLEALPDPQREALEVALLRRRPSADAPDPRAAAVATLGVVRAAKAEGPTIIAIDDVPWLDPATARVLAFALRRLPTEPIGVLVCRPATGEATPSGLADPMDAERFRTLHVDPLGAHEIGVIVRDRTGVALSKPDVQRLAELCGGNPFYALEIARARERGDEGVTGQRLPIPRSLQEDLVRARVDNVTLFDPRGAPLRCLDLPPDGRGAAARDPGATLDAGLKGRSMQGWSRSSASTSVSLIPCTARPSTRTPPVVAATRCTRGSPRSRRTPRSERANSRSPPTDRIGRWPPRSRRASSVGPRARFPRGRRRSRRACDPAHTTDDPASMRRRLLLSAQDRMSAGDGDGARERAREALRLSEPGEDQAEPLRRIGAIEFSRGALAEARASLAEALVRASDNVPRMRRDPPRTRAGRHPLG